VCLAQCTRNRRAGQRTKLAKRKKEQEPVDITKLPVEKKGGAIVYAEKDGQTLFCFGSRRFRVLDSF